MSKTIQIHIIISILKDDLERYNMVKTRVRYNMGKSRWGISVTQVGFHCDPDEASL